ncbi:uncharacterized protein LOC120431962 isoform X1 [Culex pipiens pallens]|uniref:uncharacterized protein LOC120431962 isoform X1 n=1 Tax=Culex pipiens pallens TaxID=42434 RepID=UPI0019546423|nr:uncharacterized protein LOC120431962 isoform X1 [Culex pipiens pallens]
MASTTLPDCHWELCHRFMARYQHLFREGQVATLAHFFANTQLAISGHAHQTGQLLLELVRDQAEVKLEVENVENGVGEEAELESVPTEVTIKQEASEDGECAARKEVEVEEPSKSTQIATENAETLVSAGCSEITSMELSSNFRLNDPPLVKPPAMEPMRHESDAEIIAKLTFFKPARYIRSLENLYRNLVIFDTDFDKTINELNRLGSGTLFIAGHELQAGQCRGMICLRETVLADACGITVQQAKGKAKEEFLRNMKAFCYQIVSKKPTLPPIQIARLWDPATNIEYYKSIMQKSTEEETQRELIFSEEFTENEQYIFKRIADGLNLETSYVRRAHGRPQLKVRPRAAPALAIVEQIVVHKDPKLNELYDVFPPRGRSRRW